MAKDNGKKGDEVPPRTYGVHWPSNPAPGSDAPSPEAEAPKTAATKSAAPKSAAPAPQATAPQSPAKKSAGSPAGPPPPPVIPPLPPTSSPSRQPAQSPAPAAEMPAALPREATPAMPATPSPAAVPEVVIPQVVAPPATVAPEAVAPPAVTPQPVAPQDVAPSIVAPEPVYIPVAEATTAPEPVYVPRPADLLIPVPSGSPGLPVDPLTSPEIPVLPPVATPTSVPLSDTSGLSRREMRKLREQATARIGEPADSLSRIEEAAAMAATPQAVQSPYVATGQPASLFPAQPSQVVQPGYTAQPVQPVQYAPSVPLSTTLPGIPAAAVEMAAITGRLDIIEATQTPLAPTLSSGPTVAQLRAMEEASRAAMARDVVLESTLPGLSTTGGLPTSGHSLIVSNVPTDIPSALSAMNETGEIIVTGQIILPASVAQTGTDMRRFDTAEIDVVAEREPQTGNVGNLAPVSATRAVSAFSSHTTSSLPPRVGSHRLPMVLALIAAGLAVGVVGLFVANIFLKFF